MVRVYVRTENLYVRPDVHIVSRLSTIDLGWPPISTYILDDSTAYRARTYSNGHTHTICRSGNPLRERGRAFMRGMAGLDMDVRKTSTISPLMPLCTCDAHPVNPSRSTSTCCTRRRQTTCPSTSSDTQTHPPARDRPRPDLDTRTLDGISRARAACPLRPSIRTYAPCEYT